MPDPINCREQILSEDYRDFITGAVLSGFLSSLSPESLCIQGADSQYYCLYLPAETAEPLTFERFPYNTIPKCYTPISMETLNQTGILAIQNFPTLQLKGEGIILGFMDSGIDYTLPIFRNLDGTSRIVGIWDQTVQSGTPPDTLAYGSEFSNEQLNLALENEDPLSVVPTVDTDGHGTFIAGLAAGSGEPSESFLGAAPESSIAVVKLKQAKQYLRDYYFIPQDSVCYQETDLILGLKYLVNLARRLSLPLVLCIAVGTNSGGHIGSLPFSNILDSYASRTNIIPVVGVGNEADKRHHFQGTLAAPEETRTVEIRVGNNVSGFTAELWTSVPDIVSVSLVSPGGEHTSFTSIRAAGSFNYSFLLERTQVSVDYRLFVEGTNAELIFFRFQAPSPGIWKITVQPLRLLNGIFHMWLPVTEFLSGEVFFLESNPYYTITNPGNATGPLVIAYYNGSNNAVSLSSGRGYESGGHFQPTLAAPGIDVRGALPGGRFATRSGSSIATAVSAGAAALLLEWILKYGGPDDGLPGVDTYQIKNLFILGAVRPVSMDFPNREWGYGLLNLFQVFEVIRQL